MYDFYFLLQRYTDDIIVNQVLFFPPLALLSEASSSLVI